MEQGHWDEMCTHFRPVQTEDMRGFVAVDAATGKMLAAQVFCLITGRATGQAVQTHSLVLDRRPLFYGWVDFLQHYAFNVLGVSVVYGLVPADNKRAIAINRKMGALETGRIPNGDAPGVDLIVMSLQAEDRRHGR